MEYMVKKIELHEFLSYAEVEIYDEEYDERIEYQFCFKKGKKK